MDKCSQEGILQEYSPEALKKSQCHKKVYDSRIRETKIHNNQMQFVNLDWTLVFSKATKYETTEEVWV